jgi:hypothetical protein
MACQCEQPTRYTKPSGVVVCVNQHCGARIEAPTPPKERA